MEAYADSQVKGVIEELGIRIESLTSKNYICFCPYHPNTQSASFSVSRTTGMFICYNPACGKSGALTTLVMSLSDKNYNQTLRLLRNAEANIDYFAEIQKRLEKTELEEFDQAKLDALRGAFWQHSEPQDYMHGRGFTDETLQYFDVGWSEAQRMVIVPMHDFRGKPVGLVGRSIVGKAFKNSKDLPKSETFWNLHRVRRYEEVIIVESIFDAMKLHQCGYPNAVALLGGSFSEAHNGLLNRYFQSYVLATDADVEGRMLAGKISAGLRHKIIKDVRFPSGKKDIGDLESDQVVELIEGARSKLEQQLVVQW